MNVTQLVKAALAGASLAVLATGASFAATRRRRPRRPPLRRSSLARSRPWPDERLFETNTTIQVTSNLQRDEVDDYGQALTFNGQTTYKVKEPNAFDIEVSEGGKTRNTSTTANQSRSLTQRRPSTPASMRLLPSAKPWTWPRRGMASRCRWMTCSTGTRVTPAPSD